MIFQISSWQSVWLSLGNCSNSVIGKESRFCLEHCLCAGCVYALSSLWKHSWFAEVVEKTVQSQTRIIQNSWGIENRYVKERAESSAHRSNKTKPRWHPAGTSGRILYGCRGWRLLAVLIWRMEVQSWYWETSSKWLQHETLKNLNDILGNFLRLHSEDNLEFSWKDCLFQEKFSEYFHGTDVNPFSSNNMNLELWLVMENLSHLYSLYWVWWLFWVRCLYWVIPLCLYWVWNRVYVYISNVSSGF